MEKSILKKLYDGELNPAENITVDTAEYREVMRALNDEKAYLLKTLSDTDRTRFEQIEELYGRLISLYGYEDFAYGYRLAVALIFESHDVSQKLFRKK